MSRNSNTDLVLEPGKNCWQTTRAERLGWLIDGEDYFRALRDSFGAAEREIIIVGWDIDSRVELIRDESDPRHPSPLCETLTTLVDGNPNLNIYILSWDFAAVYMLERELLPALSFGWTTSERMHFKLDGEHAHGASHHQKIVIIDGKVGYVGGFDITKCRWDTREHTANDARRTDTDGNQYRPFHDVQAIVSGAVVDDLRELASERWERACGEPLPDIEHTDGADVWPTDTPVHANDVGVALARTFVDIDGGERIQEVEQLYLDMIASARRSIYIENQYFTSKSIAEALAESLQGDVGPEIVVVLPGVTSGWLEQATMDLLRNRAIAALREADRHGRLRIVAPVKDALGDNAMNVHAKLIVIDDRWLRIGSANLSRRSMGLDSECDLVVDARDGDAAITLCADLLSEHLGADCDALHEMLKTDGLFATIDKFNDGDMRLEALEVETGEFDSWLEPLADIADMERPILNPLATDSQDGSSGDDESSDAAPADPLQGANGAADPEVSHKSLPTPPGGWLFIIALAALLGFAIYWVMSGKGDGFDLGQLLGAVREFAGHPLAPLVMVVVIIAGSLLVAPITGMIAICALVFDPWVASLAALTGTLLATTLNHWIGARFGNVLTSRVPDRVARRIESFGKASDVLSLAALRLIPIAPFTVINLIVGAAGVRLRPFIVGTLIGMGPGTVLICLSVDRARAALSGEAVFDPTIIIAITLAAIAFIALRLYLKRDKGGD